MARARAFPYQAGFDPRWRGSPPHLVPAERLLMFWYLDNQRPQPDEIWYDTPLDGEDPRTAQYPGAAAILDPTELRTWYTLTARRADAIERTGETYRVIELRDRAGMQTLGEAAAYSRLAAAEWPQFTWSAPVVVARIYDNGIRATMRQLGFLALSAPENLYDPAKIDTRYVPSVNEEPTT